MMAPTGKFPQSVFASLAGAPCHILSANDAIFIKEFTLFYIKIAKWRRRPSPDLNRQEVTGER